jgi:hypothetical protein
MLHHMTPKSTLAAHAVILPRDGEESFRDMNTGMTTAPANSYSLYALTIALRVGLLAAILLKAFAIWQW